MHSEIVQKNPERVKINLMRYGISAASIVLRGTKVLLVHHYDPGRYDFWLPPGGSQIGSESIFDCARRETFEETGLVVDLERILYIQEFIDQDFHFCKFFVLSTGYQGELSLRNRLDDERFLIDARFLSRDELLELDVKPDILQDQFWDDAARDFPTTRYLGLEVINSPE